MLCAYDGGHKNDVNKVIQLNRTENKQGNKRGILWLQTTHVGLLILSGLVSVTECLLCWKNLQHRNRVKGSLHYCYQLISLFHQSFLRGKVLRRLQVLQVVIQRWIQRSISLQQVATALGREPARCWVLVPQDASAATRGTDGHFGLENTVWWVLAPGSHRYLHILSAAPTWTPPPQPVPDRLRQSAGRSLGGSLGHPVAVPGGQDTTKQIGTNHRAGARSCKPLSVPGINLLMLDFREMGGKVLRDTPRASVCVLSPVRLFVTPWTVAHHSPLSMEFSWQEYWSGLQFPPRGAQPTSLAPPALAGRVFTLRFLGSPQRAWSSSYLPIMKVPQYLNNSCVIFLI